MPTETSRPQPTSGGVIHDIGYRHYDGPRLGRTYARRTLLVHSLRGAYGLGRTAKSKVAPMLLLGAMALPALILVAVTLATDADALPLDYTQYAILLQAVIGLFLASQAPQLVSRDLRFHTTPLYFSRPIERRDYVVAKLGAMFGALLVFIGLPVVLLYVGALLAKLDFVDQTRGFAQGMVAAVVMAALYAGIGLVLAALTPRRGFGVAAIIATLTLPYGAVSTLQPICFDLDERSLVPWLGLGSPSTLVDLIQSAFLDASPSWIGGQEPTTAAGLVAVLLVAGLLAGCYAVLMRRYRKAGL